MSSAPSLFNAAEPIETGVLHRDDNLATLQAFPAECVDLIYLDPPFFSNRFYEVIWGDEAEVRSFEDRWEGGMQVYIDWMEKRLVQMRRVLKRSGSIYLHCDPHASHYLKVAMDQIFGGSNYRNEIIWKRTSSHSSANRFGPVHDTILYYGNGPKVTWNSARTDYDPEYLAKYYKYHDGDGRLYWRNSLTAAGIRKGSSGEPWRGFDVTATGQHWKFKIETLEKLDAEGKIYWPLGGRGFPQIKRYRDELKGKTVDDIWVDIDRINPKAAERLGYPTQKPEALLKRIVEASSNRGDIVLDPFCGCGTSVAVAEQLKRRWVGIDISPTAIDIMQKRIWRIGSRVKIVNAVDTISVLKALKPFEFQNWIINAINGTPSARPVHDMGIDGYWFFTREPVQVKQSEHIGRNVVDNFETAIRRAGHNTGYIIAFSFTRGAAEEVARARHDGLDIRLVKAAEVLLLVKRPHGKLGPQPGSIEEIPITAKRSAKDLPTAEELIESDRRAVAG